MAILTGPRWISRVIYGVLRFDPKGRLERIVEMPATRPTCVVFGGAKLDTIYVTSSCANLPKDVLAKHPLQGGLFCFDSGTRGFPKHKFGLAQ
jgi:L-arabinonolactonase